MNRRKCVLLVMQISPWMTSNLLTLNSSKTGFLFIGVKQQLAKLQNMSLNITHSARNLGVIFYENLPSEIRYHHSLGPATTTFVLLCCIHPYLDFKTANIIATSIVHSKLDYCNSLYFSLPKTQINRLHSAHPELLCSHCS